MAHHPGNAAGPAGGPRAAHPQEAFAFRHPGIRQDSERQALERTSPSGSRTDILPGMDQQRWTIAALLLFALGFSALMNSGLEED